MSGEERLAAAAGCFRDAAQGRASWENAVQAYAGALDIPHGQMVAFGHESLVTLNIVTSEALTELEGFGGHAPAVNSRVRVGSRAPELKFLDERDFSTALDVQANREYGDWMDRHRLGYSCVTPLLRHGGVMVGLAALRTRSQDEMSMEERRGFLAIAANARSAVNLAVALENSQANSLAAALETLRTAVIIFDLAGQVMAMSSSAERDLAGGGLARVAGGAFVPYRFDERDRFERSLAQALKARIAIDAHPPGPMALTCRDGSRVILEFVPLSQDSGFTFTAAVMVMIRGNCVPTSRAADIARELYELTAAESRVAMLLLAGLSPAKIALETGVSVGTVRNHVHRILSKSGCNSQIEFLSLISQFY